MISLGAQRRWARVLRWPAGMLMSVSASAALACSTVALGLAERPLVAYSYDVTGTGAGFVVVNSAGVQRSSIAEDAPAAWTARYGSVTFNQFGPGMPTAGMNTAGLVVTLMWNDAVTYPAGGAVHVVNELEFIQRLLDTAGSVDAALEAMGDVRIDGIVPIHFFLADSAGTVASLTPTASGFVIHRGRDMPVPALTNTSYAELIERIAVFEGFGGERALPAGDGLADPSSFERFALAADASRRAGPAATSDQAFDVLDDVANAATRWQIVFDAGSRQIAFRIVGGTGEHVIDMDGIDFRCRDLPLAVQLTEISATEALSVLDPINPEALTDVLGEVLASFPPTAEMGAEVADGLAAGLLASAACES